MVNPISTSHTNSASEAAKPAALKPQLQQTQQKSTPQHADKVTLKSTGDVNHDGDSR